MDKKIVNILKYVLWGAVAVVLLYFSFRSVQWSDFAAALKNCKWGYILLSMVFGALALLFRGLRWRMQILPIDKSTSVATCWNAYNICMVVNLVLPRVGEVVRCAYVTRRSARDSRGNHLASLDKVFGTVLVDRAWDAVSLVVVMGLMLIVLWDRFGAFFQENVFSAVSGKAGLAWIVAGVVLLGALLVWLSWRFRDRGKFWAKVWGVISGLGDGLASCMHMRHGYLFILYTAVIWGLYWMMSATVMWSIQGMDPTLLSPELAGALDQVNALTMTDALFLMFAGAVSSLVPVPGGFGAFHTVVAGALLSVYGIPFPLGLIFATLSHESQVVTDVICGAASYACETVRK